MACNQHPTSRPEPSRATGRRFSGLMLATLALALCAQAAIAQILPRNLPPEAKRAQVRHVQEMLLSIDGKPVMLSPGGHIRDRNNLIIVPSQLPADGALGRYLLDSNGQASRIWLLTAEEAAGNDKQAAPR
jgi:hypothetical protein